MFLIRHPQCYLYSQYITICKQSPITNKTYLSTPTSNRTWFVCGNRSGHDNTFTPVYGGVRVAHCFSFLCCVFVLFVFVLSCVLNVASFTLLSIIGCAKNKHKQHNKTSVLLQTTLKTNRTSYQRIINTDQAMDDSYIKRILILLITIDTICPEYVTCNLCWYPATISLRFRLSINGNLFILFRE